MMNENNGEERGKSQQVRSALLLTPEAELTTRGTDSEDIIFAANIILVQDPVTKRLVASVMSDCVVEGVKFELDQSMLHTTVTLLREDLTLSRVVNSLAEVLISQEG